MRGIDRFESCQAAPIAILLFLASTLFPILHVALINASCSSVLYVLCTMAEGEWGLPICLAVLLGRQYWIREHVWRVRW
jgi:nitrate reductase NapE component